MSGPVVTAIKEYALRLQVDPNVVEYERIVYKTALANAAGKKSERMFNRMCDAAAADALIMLDAIAARGTSRPHNSAQWLRVRSTKD